MVFFPGRIIAQLADPQLAAQNAAALKRAPKEGRDYTITIEVSPRSLKPGETGRITVKAVITNGKNKNPEAEGIEYHFNKAGAPTFVKVLLPGQTEPINYKKPPAQIKDTEVSWDIPFIMQATTGTGSQKIKVNVQVWVCYADSCDPRQKEVNLFIFY